MTYFGRSNCLRKLSEILAGQWERATGSFLGTSSPAPRDQFAPRLAQPAITNPTMAPVNAPYSTRIIIQSSFPSFFPVTSRYMLKIRMNRESFTLEFVQGKRMPRVNTPKEVPAAIAAKLPVICMGTIEIKRCWALGLQKG